MLQLGERVVEEARVDGLLDLHDLLHCALPVDCQDIAGQLPPCCGVDFVVVGGEDAELVEQLSSRGVVSTGILELSKIIQLIHHLRSHAVVLLEVVHVAVLVTPQVVDDIFTREQRLNLLRLLLKDAPSLEHFFAFRGIFRGSVGERVQVCVEVADEVVHIGLFEERIFQLGDVFGRLVFRRLFLLEVEEREHEVAVEVRDEGGEKAVLLRDIGGRHDRGVLREEMGWYGGVVAVVVLVVTADFILLGTNRGNSIPNSDRETSRQHRMP